MPSYTQLRGVTDIGDNGLSDQLKTNLIMYYDWAFLGIGGFSNAEFSSASGVYGGDVTKLRMVTTDGYDGGSASGQVWQAFRKDWVWESGVEYPYQPISISGVYVDSVFLPKASGGYSINYKEGAVIFDEPIAASSDVHVEYSYRYVSFYPSDVPWFRELLFSTYRVDDDQFDIQGSGYRELAFQNGIQMPCVVVEPVPRRNLRGLQLGGGRWISTDVLFHIYAELPSDRDRIFDILSTQHQCTILSFDVNEMAENNGFPLDYAGDIMPSGKCYPDLIEEYPWKKIFMQDTRGQDTTSYPPLFRGIVRTTFEIDFPEI